MARGLDQSRWCGGSRARELGGPESSRQKSRRSGQDIGVLQVTTSPRLRLVGRSLPSGLGQTCGMASGCTSSTMKCQVLHDKWRQQCVELVWLATADSMHGLRELQQRTTPSTKRAEEICETITTRIGSSTSHREAGLNACGNQAWCQAAGSSPEVHTHKRRGQSEQAGKKPSHTHQTHWFPQCKRKKNMLQSNQGFGSPYCSQRKVCDFSFNRCLRQGSVEAPRLWQKMATQLLANVEKNWTGKRIGILLDLEGQRTHQICSFFGVFAQMCVTPLRGVATSE